MTTWNYIAIAAALKPAAIALVIGGLCSAANADDEIKTSWRLLGPAASMHFSNYGAPVTDSATVQVNDGSNIVNQSSKIISPADQYWIPAFPGETAAAYCGRADGLFPMPNEAYRTQCRKDLSKPHGVVVPTRRSYNGNNYGLGVEYTRRTTDSVGRYYGGIVKDSYSNPSVYLGSAYQWTISDRSRFRADAGLITMLWRRSIADSNGVVSPRLIVAALPVLSIEDKPSGLGVNISFVPKFSWKGEQRTVNTLMVQASYEIK